MLTHTEGSVNGSTILGGDPPVPERAGLLATLTWIGIQVLRLLGYCELGGLLDLDFSFLIGKMEVIISNLQR